MSDVTPIRPDLPPPPQADGPDYADLEDALAVTRAAFACATSALWEAQSNGNEELRANAWLIIGDAERKLVKFAEDLARWHLTHEHTPKNGGRS